MVDVMRLVPADRDAVPVDDALKAIRKTLKGLGHIAVVGELVSFNQHRSGHWYLTISGEQGKIEAAFYRERRHKRPPAVVPTIGQTVRVSGEAGVYLPHGRLSLQARSLEVLDRLHTISPKENR
jgi:exonuclease VII large subunit